MGALGISPPEQVHAQMTENSRKFRQNKRNLCRAYSSENTWSTSKYVFHAPCDIHFEDIYFEQEVILYVRVAETKIK